MAVQFDPKSTCVSAFNNGAFKVAKDIAKLRDQNLKDMDKADLSHWQIAEKESGKCLSLDTIQHKDIWLLNIFSLGEATEKENLQAAMKNLNADRWSPDFTGNLEAFGGLVRFFGNHATNKKNVADLKNKFLKSFPKINNGKSRAEIASQNGAMVLLRGFIPVDVTMNVLFSALDTFAGADAADPCAQRENMAFVKVLKAGWVYFNYATPTNDLAMDEKNLSALKTWLDEASATSSDLNGAQRNILNGLKAQYDISVIKLNERKTIAAARAQAEADAAARAAAEVIKAPVEVAAPAPVAKAKPKQKAKPAPAKPHAAEKAKPAAEQPKPKTKVDDDEWGADNPYK